MYRRIQSILVICCFLFLLAYDTHGLQLVTRNVYEAEIYFFLSKVILGLNSLGQNIDVCIWPSIDKLKQLWSSGALTYNISRK